MRRRQITSRAELRMTVAEVHARMREIGTRGDANDPEYETIRVAAVRALVQDHYPRVDAPTAAKIFDGWRLRPNLLPGAPPRSTREEDT